MTVVTGIKYLPREGSIIYHEPRGSQTLEMT